MIMGSLKKLKNITVCEKTVQGVYVGRKAQGAGRKAQGAGRKAQGAGRKA